MFFAQQTEQTLAFNVNRPPHLSCNTKSHRSFVQPTMLKFVSLLCNLYSFIVGNITTTSPFTEITLMLLRCKQVTPREGGGGSYMKGVGLLVVSLRGVNFGFWLILCPRPYSLEIIPQDQPVLLSFIHESLKQFGSEKLLSIFASLAKKYRFPLKNAKQTLCAVFNTAQG